MERNGFERGTAELLSSKGLSHLNGVHGQERSVPAAQRLNEEVGRLRPEVEWERQEAFQRTPQSDETGVGNDAENEESDGSDSSKPGDRGDILRRRPVRLALALIAAALLCAGGLRFWDYLQSYEWTDDAEIDGHLDPVSTRINDTVIHVYVENTYHVSQGQALVDLDPRDYQIAVENAAANLVEAQQSVLAARQDYDLPSRILTPRLRPTSRLNGTWCATGNSLTRASLPRRPTTKSSRRERSPRPQSTRTVQRSPRRQD